MMRFYGFSKKVIAENKYLFLIFLFYFVFRFINLTKLPIFNDEAIYIDWGIREINKPGNLYYSLYDAKQPLLMWMFAVSANFIKDPLFAGRIISLIAGFITLLGLYKLSFLLFDKKVAMLSAIFYILIPIFSFFDRQALMESAISAVGVWVCFFLLNKQSKKNAALVGIVLGIGFFIKSSSLVFLLSSFCIYFIYFFKNNKKTEVFESLLIVIGAFLASISLLLINPMFWSTFHTNSRYTITISEILSFPFAAWIKNFLGNLEISFFYLTPIVFVLSIAGIIKILKDEKNKRLYFIVFFIVAFFTETIFIRSPSNRYLVSFLPFLVICLSFIIAFILAKYKKSGILILALTMLVPFSISAFQLSNPPGYISFMSKYTNFNDSVYINGFTSGYGINEAVNYFKDISKNKQIYVGVAENTGNPESAILVYFNKKSNIQPTYFDSRLIDANLGDYNCIESPLPMYFVSRDNQLFGLDKFLIKIKTIKNPYGTNTIGIYMLKTNCKGKTLKMTGASI